jgi:site-specific DNA-methyltransferase (adenine-specific)
MEIIYKKIDDIKPYVNNPRFNDDAVDAVKNSIKEFGFKVPIILDKNNEIVAGHTRYKASLELGLKEVPCIVADDLNEEQIKAFRLADNKVAEKAEWDIDLLNNELDDILNIDMSDFGFDLDLEDEEEKEIIEDEVPEVPEEPKAKLGDIYQLGNHRLMCGDSTKEEDVAKLMNGVKADMVFTDPPYGIDIVQGKKVGGDKSFGKVDGGSIVKSNTYSTIIGDSTTDTARKNYEIIKEISNNQIIFGGNYFTDFLKPSKCWCVWDKQNTGNFADVELAWTSFDKGAKIYHYLWNGLVREGSRDLELSKRVHPTQKPVGMIINILKDFTEENNSIIDCFGGSGSTLIACEQLNRKCYMMELDEHYVDVIIQRWENFTGEKAIKLN